MPLWNAYKVTNRITGESKDVAAPSAQEACRQVGWRLGYCLVHQLTRQDTAAMADSHGMHKMAARIRERRSHAQRRS